MQERKMREHIVRVENAEVENVGATKYGKPSEENTLKYQTNYGCRGFHAYLLPNASHKRVSLLTLLPTIDSVSDVSRVSRGLAIRRAKKRVNLTNDKRIKMCSQRFDSHAYTRLQFLGGKVKEVDLYSAFIVVPHTQGAQVRITQCYLQIIPYLPLVQTQQHVDRRAVYVQLAMPSARRRC